MELSWIRDLDHVSQTGSFSLAARRSNLSQPALSRRIRAMEAWVGALLVDRSRHPVVLTGAGVQMLEAGQQALARLDSERASIRAAQARPDRRVVTFAAQHSISWRFYPAWLQALESAFGPILSRLRADDLPNCLQDLGDGVVDFVMAYESRKAVSFTSARDVESVWIGRDALVPVAKLGANGQPIFHLDRKEPAAIPFLRFGPMAAMSDHIAPLVESDRLRRRLRVVYENAMVGALRIRVREGSGLAWLPKSLVAPDLEAGFLGHAGGKKWEIALDIKLHRRRQQSDALTGKIWNFLERRRKKPLLAVV